MTHDREIGEVIESFEPLADVMSEGCSNFMIKIRLLVALVACF